MKQIKCSVHSMPNGLMTYWEEVKEAAIYHVRLFIGDVHKESTIINGRTTTKQCDESFAEIACVDVPREFKYHSFTDLAPIHLNKDYYYGTHDRRSGINYYIVVEAEDRAGNIIASSERIRGFVEDDSNGPRGLRGGIGL